MENTPKLISNTSAVRRIRRLHSPDPRTGGAAAAAGMDTPARRLRASRRRQRPRRPPAAPAARPAAPPRPRRCRQRGPGAGTGRDVVRGGRPRGGWAAAPPGAPNRPQENGAGWGGKARPSTGPGGGGGARAHSPARGASERGRGGRSIPARRHTGRARRQRAASRGGAGRARRRQAEGAGQETTPTLVTSLRRAAAPPGGATPPAELRPGGRCARR